MHKKQQLIAFLTLVFIGTSCSSDDNNSSEIIIQASELPIKAKTFLDNVFTNIDIADQILMFDQGKIVAKGTHSKLYEKNKKYREFYNLQERSLEENA